MTLSRLSYTIEDWLKLSNPYEPLAQHEDQSPVDEERRTTFSRRTAVGIWILGFSLQLASYTGVIMLMFFEDEPQFSATYNVEFNPDLALIVFNLGLAFFGLISIFGIIRCRDFTPSFKWSASGGSAIFFGLCWLCFVFTAVMIAFSGGFQGE